MLVYIHHPCGDSRGKCRSHPLNDIPVPLSHFKSFKAPSVAANQEFYSPREENPHYDQSHLERSKIRLNSDSYRSRSPFHTANSLCQVLALLPMYVMKR